MGNKGLFSANNKKEQAHTSWLKSLNRNYRKDLFNFQDEFREFLCRRFDLSFASNAEYNKFWKRVDLDGFNALKTEAIVKRIAGPGPSFNNSKIRSVGYIS